MSEEITVCKECTSLILDHAEGVVGRRGDDPIWYEMLCGAAPLPKGINPLTGQENGYVGPEQDPVFVGQDFEYCRDRNKGHCQDFVVRSQEETFFPDIEPVHADLPEPREGHPLQHGEDPRPLREPTGFDPLDVAGFRPDLLAWAVVCGGILGLVAIIAIAATG